MLTELGNFNRNILILENIKIFIHFYSILIGWDNKNFKIYDVSTMIMIGEQSDPSNKFAEFKCYIDSNTKEFFIEIN